MGIVTDYTGINKKIWTYVPNWGDTIMFKRQKGFFIIATPEKMHLQTSTILLNTKNKTACGITSNDIGNIKNTRLVLVEKNLFNNQSIIIAPQIFKK